MSAYLTVSSNAFHSAYLRQYLLVQFARVRLFRSVAEISILYFRWIIVTEAETNILLVGHS